MSDILERLRQGTQLDSHGYFTLDRRKALEKMRDFQLVDAHDYVLFLVQGAVAGGATAIDVGITAGQPLTLFMAGVVLEREFLEQPLSGLFVSQERHDAEAWRCLSIAFNALLSLHAKVEIESGDRRLRIESSDRQVLRDHVEPAVAGTRIRISEGWWKAATRALSAVPEVRALRERAWTCPIPITLHGEAISGGDTAMRQLAAERPYFEAVRVEERGVRALMLATEEAAGRVTIAKNGVVLAERVLTLALSPRVLVFADDLITNASGSDLVEDERWQTVQSVLANGAEQLVTALVGSSMRDPTHRAAVRSLLLIEVGNRFKVAKGSIQPRQGVRAGDAALREVPLFTGLERSEGVALDLLDGELKQHKDVLQYLDAAPLPGTPDRLVLRPDGDDERAALQAVLGAALHAVDARDPIVQRLANMAKWSRGSGLPQVESRVGDIEVRTFNDGGFSGEMRLGSASQTTLAVYADGRFLVETVADCYGLRFRAAVNSGRFKPSFMYDDVVRDEAWKAAVEFLAEQYEAACEQLCRRVPPTSPQALDVAPHVMAVLHWYRQALRDPSALPDGLRRFPVLPTASGRRASIADLERDVDEFHQLHYAREVPQGEQKDHRQIVVDEAIALLPYWFRKVKAVDYSRALRLEREALKRLGSGPSLSGQAVNVVEIAEGEIHGALGMSLAVDGARRDDTVVRVLRQGRLLGMRTVTLSVGPLEAVVDAPDLTPTPTWDGVVDDDTWRRVLRLLTDAVPRVVASVAAELQRLEGWRARAAEKMVTTFITSCGRNGPPQALAAARLLPTLAAERASLEDLRQALEEHGAIRFVFVEERREVPPGVGDARVIRFVDDRDPWYGMLRAVLGEGALENWTRELEAKMARLAFLAQPRSRPALRQADSAYLSTATVTHDGMAGKVGLPPASAAAPLACEVLIMREGRPLDVVRVGSLLPAEAVLESDAFEPDRTWKSLAPGASTRAIGDAVDLGVRAAIDALTRTLPVPHGSASFALLRCAVGCLRGSQDDPLLQRLQSMPLIETLDGKLSLHDALELLRAERRLLWVRHTTQGKSDAGRILRLTNEEERLLREILSPLANYERELVLDAVAQANRERRRLRSTRLGGEALLARVEVDTPELRGELAVSSHARSGVVLARDGVMLADGPLFGAVPVVGIIMGTKFEPTRTWDGLHMRSRDMETLEALLDRLMLTLAPRAATQETARQALLSWYVRRHDQSESIDPAALPEIFELVGGQRVSLRELTRCVKQHGRLHWSRHDGQPSDEFPVVIADEATRNFLTAFFGRRLLSEVDPPPVLTAARRIWAQIKALGPAAMDAARHTGERLLAAGLAVEKRVGADLKARTEGTARDRKQRRDAARLENKLKLREEARREREQGAAVEAVDPLVASLRRCFAEIPWLAHRRWPTSMLTRIELGRVARGALLDASGRALILNSAHRLVERVRKLPQLDRETIACLASAVFTELNRLREDLRDEDEIRFMQDLADWVMEA